MAKLEKMRSDALLEKNKAALKAIELGKKSDELKEKSDNIKEGISRIPKDLPDDLQQQVDAACEKVSKDLKAEAKALQKEADDAQDDADLALEKMREDGQDLQKKGERLGNLREIPLLGVFADKKSTELRNFGDQLFDIAKETQDYSDKLAAAQNQLSGI